MVKRLTLILCLLAGGARATVVTTSASGNLSALSFGVNDTIIVANTHTLTVDAANSLTTPIVRMIFVRSGGTLAFSAGMGLMCNAVVLGNRASAPFSSANGGTLTMAATSYLYLRHDAAFTYDVEPGPNSTVTISVNVTNPANAAQIYMDTPGTYGYGRFYVGNTTAAITLSGVRFKYFIRAFGSGGVEFNASGRAATTTTLFKCFFDTSNVAFINVTGHKANQCTFNLPVINNNGAVYIAGGVKDTVWASTITVDANGGAEGDQKGIYINGQDSTVIQGCTIQELNSASFGANSYGILIGGDYPIIKHCTVTGFGFTIATASTADISGLIDSCFGYGTTTTHEWVILHAGDTGWTIRGNDIRFISGGGRSAITFYPSTTPPPHAYIYYNTINAAYGGSPAASAIGFEHTAAGNMTYNGVKMVGNILIGNNTGFNRAEMIFGTTAAQTVTVNFSEFKDNAFDSCYYYGTSSATYPYSRLDSNKHDQTSFGFVDSAAGDFRLDVASPLLNCGDSTYAVGVFGSAQASKTPFDIGYYQSYTTGTCGGAPATPTGACCYNTSTCAVMTQAQCTALSGTYQGDGTTACSNCTQSGGGVTGPSPYSKQLKIASLCYYAPWWNSGNNLTGYVSGMRDWAANRYAMVITTGATPASVSYMKGVNPNLKVLQYSKFGRAASDTATLRAMCDTLGFNFRNVVLHTGTANVTTTMPVGGDCYGCTASMTTTADSSPILFHFWQAAQTRVSLDPRNWQSGALLWRILKYEMRNGTAGTSDDIDGILLDEETRWTGTFPGEAPILPTDGDTWATSIINPFTGISDANLPDSQASWRRYWAKALGDSAVANNKIITPNGTSYWGVQASQGLAGWTGEGRHATNLYHSAFLNEDHRSYYYNSVDQLKNWPKLTYDLKDSGATIILPYIPVGMVDSSCGNLSFPRQKMNFLGHALNCTFSGTSNVYFSPKWSTFGQYTGSNDVHHNYGGFSYVCRTLVFNDTTAEWSPTWGKYFGLPVNTKDTATSGTDPQGQAYKVFRSAFTHPTNGVSDTLTISLMRYDQGTINTAATAISVTLPSSHTWYELLDNTFDSAGIGAANQSLWRATGYAGGSTITLMNSQARVFSSDTTLANTGFGQASTGNASIDDVSVTEGGTMTFTVTLSAAQSVPTTLSYSTSDGTATGNTSCTGSYDYVSTIGGKSIPIGATSTTITIPTCNRASCQASRAFTVTFNVTSPATITVTDPTGTGTILDDDCGTTYGKTYKGKIVIKGKVKP